MVKFLLSAGKVRGQVFQHNIPTKPQGKGQKIMHKILVVLATTTLFTACEEPKHDVRDTVFTPQVKALEKARAVEDTVQQNAERTRAAVDSIGQENESQTER